MIVFVHTTGKALVAAAVATLLLAAPVCAQTVTAADAVGDVDVWADWSDAPTNPYADAVDLESLTVAASRKRVRVTLDVADVLTVSDDYAQEFTVNLVPTRRRHDFGTTFRVTIAASDRLEWGPECRGDVFTDVLSGIDSQVTCARDVEDDLVTLRIPTSVFPRWARFLRVTADSWSFVMSDHEGWEISSRDGAGHGPVIRIG